MTPYPTRRLAPVSSVLSLLIGLLLILLPLHSFAANGAASQSKLADSATRSGFEHFYNMEYDAAIRDFERVLAANPNSPAAVNHLLSGIMFKELYRIGVLDSELYAKEDFITSKQRTVDPKVRDRVKELMDRALQLSEEALKKNPNDVEALYARGVTRGMRATYTGLVDKAWFSALRSAIGARRDHERVLELNPNYSDAKMIVGMHNYIVGSLSWAVKIAASVVGVSGSKEKGIQYLYDAANGGGYSAVDAKITLSIFLRREQRYAEAIKLIDALADRYRKNFLVALEHANLLNAAGHGPEAIAAYRKLLASGKAGIYFEPRLEQAAYMLGEALRGQRDYKAAAEAYDQAAGYRDVEPELRERALLAAGEAYDLANRRDLAVRRYQEVIAADSKSRRAELARKYLKHPFQEKTRG